MAAISEDFHSCIECDNDTFIAVELLTISKRAGDKYMRDNESLPLPDHLVEKKIVYRCSKCGLQLNV